MANKLGNDRNQKILLELASISGNDVCADCKSRMPRWASHSLGIFICVRCASIHRKIGTHVTKVKSLTMDTWTKEQVETMKTVGNLRSNQVYHPDEKKHPPPANLMESERDSEIEKFIRDKYEFKKFKPTPAAIAASMLGPSRSAAQARLAPAVPPRSNSLSPAAVSTARGTSPAPVPPPQRAMTQPPTAFTPATSSTAPISSQSTSSYNDLLSLQAPSVTSSLPLQYSPLPTSTTLHAASAPISIPGTQYGMGMASGAGGMGMGSSPSGFNSGLNPPSFTGLSSSPSGTATYMSPGGLGMSPSFMSSSPNMGMFAQPSYQQPTPPQLLPNPSPYASQTGSTPYGSSYVAPGSSPSPGPMLMNTGMGFSSSPNLNGASMNGGMNLGGSGFPPIGMGAMPGTSPGYPPNMQMQPNAFGQQMMFAQPQQQPQYGGNPAWNQHAQQGWPGM